MDPPNSSTTSSKSQNFWGLAETKAKYKIVKEAYCVHINQQISILKNFLFDTNLL